MVKTDISPKFDVTTVLAMDRPCKTRFDGGVLAGVIAATAWRR